MSVYLDTSILVSALTVEPGSASARALLARGEAWIISEWAAAEFSSAIRVKAQGPGLEEARIPALEAGLEALMTRYGTALPIQGEDIRHARALVMRNWGVRAPDALHIAAALRVGARLATLDRKQARMAEAVGVDVVWP